MSKENPLVIKTADNLLANDLRNLNIENLKIYQSIFTCDSAEWIPPIQKILTFVVEGTTNIEFSLFASWLYERVKKDNTGETTINDKDIIQNPEQITIIINSQIQIINDNCKK